MTAVVIANGVVYRGDPDDQTITPADETSEQVLALMDTDRRVGPGVDEFAGVLGTWRHYPLSMICAFMDVTDVEWFSDDGTMPDPPTGGGTLES